MRSSMKKSSKPLLIVLFPLLLSCATTLPGRQYSQGNIVDMGHFSIIGPPGDGWFVNIQKGQETVEFTKRNVSQATGSVNEAIVIRVFRNWITDEKIQRLSEEEVADDFRAKEEAGMLMMGVIRGEYDLTNVKKETTMIGNKKLYLMSYRTSGVSKGPTRQKWISDSVLYLFFPADFKEKHFFYCFQLGHLFMEGTLEKGDLTPIVPIINSFKIKGVGLYVDLSPRSRQNIEISLANRPISIKVNVLEDRRPVRSKIGERTAAFNVSMGDVFLVPDLSEFLTKAIADELSAAGHRVGDVSQDITVGGEILKFWVETKTTALYWDIVGIIEIRLLFHPSRPEMKTLERQYMSTKVERTYVWPTEKLVGKVLEACISDLIQQLRSDTIWTQEIIKLIEK